MNTVDPGFEKIVVNPNFCTRVITDTRLSKNFLNESQKIQFLEVFWT